MQGAVARNWTLHALLGLFLFGCITGKDGKKSKLSKKQQEQLEEYAAEVEVGRNMAGRLLQYFGTIQNNEVVRYINTVGRYVGTYSDYPDRRYMFQIIDSEEINAFACPGGYILVTLGAMRAIRNEAELAAILGHEVAHIGLRHMFNTLKNMDAKRLEKEAEELDKKGKIDTPRSIQVRQRPSSTSSETASLVARYLSGASGASLSVLNAAKAGMSVILEKGLDPKLEIAADREGVRYAVRAGYHPKALSGFLKRLGARKKKSGLKTLGKTHPSLSDRTRSLKKILKELDAKNIVGALGKTRFKKMAVKLPPKKKKK